MRKACSPQSDKATTPLSNQPPCHSSSPCTTICARGLMTHDPRTHDVGRLLAEVGINAINLLEGFWQAA